MFFTVSPQAILTEVASIIASIGESHGKVLQPKFVVFVFVSLVCEGQMEEQAADQRCNRRYCPAASPHTA
jgi:hypothetical protein